MACSNLSAQASSRAALPLALFLVAILRHDADTILHVDTERLCLVKRDNRLHDVRIVIAGCLQQPNDLLGLCYKER